MNKPEELTILEIVKRSIIGKNVEITVHREILGAGEVSNVYVASDDSSEWIEVEIIGHNGPVAIELLAGTIITMIDP